MANSEYSRKVNIRFLEIFSSTHDKSVIFMIKSLFQRENVDKSKQQEHSESSSAQIPKQEHSTKHAVKKDLEHLNAVRLVTRRVSTGNKEHSRKKHNTDQERRRTRRRRGGKTVSLNLAPSVQEEEKERREDREETGGDREEEGRDNCSEICVSE